MNMTFTPMYHHQTRPFGAPAISSLLKGLERSPVVSGHAQQSCLAVMPGWLQVPQEGWCPTVIYWFFRNPQVEFPEIHTLSDVCVCAS